MRDDVYRFDDALRRIIRVHFYAWVVGQGG